MNYLRNNYSNDKRKRFLKVFGYCLIGISILGFLYHVYINYHFSLSQERLYFLLIVLIWYMATGVGILIRKKWGYYLFKVFLYCLLVSFPIGTIISYLSLKYMKKNNVKDLFWGPRRGHPESAGESRHE